MTLTEYFSEDEHSTERKRVEKLISQCEEMPVNFCMLCIFEGGKVKIVEKPKDTRTNFEKLEKQAIDMSLYSQDVYVLIRANGRPFLTVGSSFGKWTRAYKMLGYNVFVLEKQDEK
jgi:hypothetical protein